MAKCRATVAAAHKQLLSRREQGPGHEWRRQRATLELQTGMVLFRTMAGALLAAVAVDAVPEQPQAAGVRCADFDPRVPLVSAPPTFRRGLQSSSCANMLSASAIAEFDAMIAQHDVMYAQLLSIPHPALERDRACRCA